MKSVPYILGICSTLVLAGAAGVVILFPAAAQDTAPQADTRAAVEGADWSDNVTITIDEAANSFNFKSNGIPEHGFAEKYLIPKGTPGEPVANYSIDDFTIVESDNFFTETPVDTDITTQPVYSSETTDTQLGRIGVALNGAQLFNDYETHERTIVALDDNAFHDHAAFIDECNGHTLADGSDYHYHGIPVCLTVNLDTEGEHSYMLGVLEDGFPVYANQDVNGEIIGNDQLDECSGHFGPTPEFPEGIYHYHLTADEAPYMVDCYHGEIEVDETRGGPPPGGAPGGGGPDLSGAAKALGISEQVLRDALGNGGPPDFDAAAKTLGISVDDLMSVLPPPPQ